MANTTTRARAARQAEPTEVRIGHVQVAQPDAHGRTYAHAYRAAIHDAAEALGYHVIQRLEPWSTGWWTLYAVRETPAEQRVIAEGLARFEAAARKNPDLHRRWGRSA